MREAMTPLQQHLYRRTLQAVLYELLYLHSLLVKLNSIEPLRLCSVPPPQELSFWKLHLPHVRYTIYCELLPPDPKDDCGYFLRIMLEKQKPSGQQQLVDTSIWTLPNAVIDSTWHDSGEHVLSPLVRALYGAPSKVHRFLQHLQQLGRWLEDTYSLFANEDR